MSRWIAAVLVVSLGLMPVCAGDPKGRLVLEHWDVIHLEGSKAGYVHTTMVELERQSQKIIRTTVDLHLNVKRFSQVLQVEAQTGNDETAEGKVVGTFMRQVLGANKDLIVVGLVKGKQLEFLVDGKASDAMKPTPWNGGVLGLYRQDSLWADKKVQPGDTFSFLSFEPQANLVVEMNVAVKSLEEVELLGKKKAKLLRVEITPEKVDKVQLPKLVSWLDEERKPVRQDTEIPGLGRVALFRSTRTAALAPGPEAVLTDIGIKQFVPLNKKVLKPYDTTSAVLRITVKDDEDAAAAFVQDERQHAVNARGTTFEMQIKAGKGPKKGLAARNPGDEFIQSSYFITAADPKVKELARRAVGRETDAWKKALLIEKWVNANMRSTNAEALAPADHVARTLEGDCTEYAMLMAAMCRAEGVPSKTAIGLIYADTKSGPAMGFHMWTEVWAAGQWVPLDATLGRGFVGATHLKVTDHSWHETRALTPLLPLFRVLGKMQVEVVSAK
jgi:transglutaminase-like putative cysteine protease